MRAGKILALSYARRFARVKDIAHPAGDEADAEAG
jgi:hypothetical protein